MELSSTSYNYIKNISKIKSTFPGQPKKYEEVLKIIYDEISSNNKIVCQYCTFMDKEAVRLESKPFNIPDNIPVSYINKFIQEKCNHRLRYKKVFKDDINVSITFYLTDNDLLSLNKFQTYIKNILTWILFAVKYSTKNCSKNININIYFTDFKKTLPNTSVEILGVNNVNTAYTYRCTANSNIVIYRKEEWFKVLIHESMHYLGLDCNTENNELLKIFLLKGKVDMKIYETYAEIWARILNVYFSSYFLCDNFNNFKVTSNGFFHLERIFSAYQCYKILNFMLMDYKDLINKDDNTSLMKRNLYKEETSVFCYYVLTSIIMDNPCKFVTWRYSNNSNMIKLYPEVKGVKSFVNYIKKHYLSDTFLENLKLVKKLSKKDGDLDKTMRMSVIELV